MTTHTEVMQQALKALAAIQEVYGTEFRQGTHQMMAASITALRAALAESEVIRSEEGTEDGNPVDEPVGKKLQSLVDGCKETKYRRDIKTAVDRFLCWKLPKDFAPDAGISFDKQHEYDSYRWPIGTNLFTDPQAKAMFEHCLEGTGYIAYPQAPQRRLSDEEILAIADREQCRGTMFNSDLLHFARALEKEQRK